MKGHTIDMERFQGFIGGGEKLSPVAPVVKEESSRLSYYRDLMEKGEIFTVSFSNQEWSEGLWKKDGDVTVWLKNDELSFGNGIYLRDSALTRKFAVKVISINEDTNTVYTSFRLAQKEQQGEVIEMINKALSKKEKFFVPARVVWFDKKKKSSHCYLDILGLGIRGTMFIDQWSHTYTDQFADVVKIGDVVNVAITSQLKRSTKEEPRYVCSRKATMEKIVDEKKWESVEELFKLHSRVVVRCIKKHPGNFVGKVLGYDDWYAYCFYPDNNEFLKIVEGMSYRGFVKSVSAEKRQLRVKVVEMVPETVASDI